MQIDGGTGGGQSRGAGRAISGGRSKNTGHVLQTMKAGGGSSWSSTSCAAAEGAERRALRQYIASGGLQGQGADAAGGQTINEVLKCPRCNSHNTKFCYYNNYSLLQPRHFCKNCRRYWTKGGALRNVPVGGGCRKNKRAALASNSGGTAATIHIKPASPSLAHHPFISRCPPSLDLLTSKTSLLQPSPSSTNDVAIPAPKPLYPLINAARLINPHFPASHSCAASFRSFLSFQQTMQSNLAVLPNASSLHQLGNHDGHIPTHNFNEWATINNPSMSMGLDLITASTTTAVPHIMGSTFKYSSSLALHGAGTNHMSATTEADDLGSSHDGRQMAQELFTSSLSTSTSRSCLQQQVDPGSPIIEYELLSDDLKVDQPVVQALSCTALLQPTVADHEAYWNSNAPASAWPDNLSDN